MIISSRLLKLSNEVAYIEVHSPSFGPTATVKRRPSQLKMYCPDAIRNRPHSDEAILSVWSIIGRIW